MHCLAGRFFVRRPLPRPVLSTRSSDVRGPPLPSDLSWTVCHAENPQRGLADGILSECRPSLADVAPDCDGTASRWLLRDAGDALHCGLGAESYLLGVEKELPRLRRHIARAALSDVGLDVGPRRAGHE